MHCAQGSAHRNSKLEAALLGLFTLGCPVPWLGFSGKFDRLVVEHVQAQCYDLLTPELAVLPHFVDSIAVGLVEPDYCFG